MAGRISAATERALAAIKAGKTPYRAALDEGLALSTIYRVIARQRAAKAAAKGTKGHRKSAKPA